MAALDARMWIPCSVCEANFIDTKSGELGSARGDRKPDCFRCPKTTKVEIWEDQRVFSALVHHRLGLTHSDAIIRADAWMYSALRLLENLEEQRAQREMKRETEREQRRIARGR